MEIHERKVKNLKLHKARALFHLSVSKFQDAAKCLHLNSVKILTNLRLDWSSRVSTSVIDKPNPEEFILIGMFLS